MDKVKIDKIFQALQTVTQEQVERIGLKDKGIKVRKGRGWATYWHPNMITRKGVQRVVSYGDGMISRTFTHPKTMDCQEMSERHLSWGQRFGYSAAVLLAAVVAHELAHAYIHFYKKPEPRRYGKRRTIHGKEFYSTLEDNFADHVEDMAIRIADLVGDPEMLESPYNPPPTPKKARRKKRKLPQPTTHQVGDLVKVYLDRQECWLVGRIIRWGGTRWTIEGQKYWYYMDEDKALAYNGKRFKMYAPDSIVEKV